VGNTVEGTDGNFFSGLQIAYTSLRGLVVAMEKIGVAVIGAGGWGRNLVRNFAMASLADLRWVCDLSEGSRQYVTQRHPGVRVTGEVQDVLSDSSVRGVVVATPAPAHFEVARQVIEAGKDVFVEKPLALSARDAEALCRLGAERDRIVMVGHLLLYHPAVRTLRQLVTEGELGEVLYLYSQRLNLGVVRRDENAWWSLAPHDISVANYLFGAEPIAVTASGGTFLQVDKGIEDVVFATLYYPEGRIAHLHVSWLDPHKTRRLTVVGSKKMAVFDDTSPDQKLALYDKGVEPPSALTYAQGVRVRTGDIRLPALQMDEPLQRECEAFLHAVQTRQAPVAGANSGLSVVRALEAGTRSLAQQGRRIEISGEER
jgi:predicted dehydrogenase